MTEYVLLLIGTVLVNNFVLVQFLGLCPFMGVSGKLDTAIGMSLATTFVLTLASVTSYLVNQYILAPLDIEFLRRLGKAFLQCVFLLGFQRPLQTHSHQCGGLNQPLGA